MLCEADCFIEAPLVDFIKVLHGVCSVLEKNNVGYFSFGDKNDIFLGPLQSEYLDEMAGCSFAYITNKIIGCQCILFPKFIREFLIDAFTKEPWDVSDIFLNKCPLSYLPIFNSIFLDLINLLLDIY